MGVRFRHGNEADLDPSKLLPGEGAVSLDTKKVFVGLGNGDTFQAGDMFKDDFANGSGPASTKPVDRSLYADKFGGYNVLTYSAPATIPAAALSCFANCNGSVPYTLTLPSPAGNAGKSITLRTNATGVTLSTPAGTFNGIVQVIGSSSFAVPAYTIVQMISDGSSWMVFLFEKYSTWIPSGTWISISSFATGWSGYFGEIGTPAYGSWQGVKYQIRNGIVTVQGAGAKTSWGANDTIFTLPSIAWPGMPVQGNNCLVDIQGNVHILGAGAGAATFGVTYQI